MGIRTEEERQKLLEYYQSQEFRELQRSKLKKEEIMSPKGVKKVTVVEDGTPKVTPTELAKLVNKNLMAPPAKSVIFKSFLVNIKDRENFIMHCLKNVDGITTNDFEEFITICKERITTQIDIDLQKQKTTIELAEKAINNLMEKKAAIDKL